VAQYPDELWRSVADLSGLLLSEEDQETTLRRVGDLAVRSIAGCDAVGVTLKEGGTPRTRAATGGLVYEVDNYQYDIDEGPCLAAVTGREIIEVVDMATEQRWPRFSSHASERGLLSSLSLPLIVRGDALGALNLYAFRSRAFSLADRQTGTMFAAQAAVAVANAQTYAASVKMAKELRDALESRAVIDQAMGILMGRNGHGPEAAFTDLRVQSQKENRKLRDIAADIVRQASECPKPPA
jgi:GAF domain-containing protein